MLRRPPTATRTYTLLTYTTLFRSLAVWPLRRPRMAPKPALPWPPAAPSKGIDPETSSPYGAPLFGAGTGGFAVPGSAAKAPNEFSRIVTPDRLGAPKLVERSEEHTSELQSLMRISYAVFCLKKKNTYTQFTRQYI